MSYVIALREKDDFIKIECSGRPQFQYPKIDQGFLWPPAHAMIYGEKPTEMAEEYKQYYSEVLCIRLVDGHLPKKLRIKG